MSRLHVSLFAGLFPVIAVTLLAAVSIAGNGDESQKPNSPSVSPQSTGGRDELLVSRDRLKAATEKVRTFKARDALVEIEKNIALLRAVRAKVEAADNIDAVIDDVADALDSMATSYEAIADMKREIELTYKDEFRTLDDVDTSTGNTLAEIRAEKARCESEIAEGDQALPNVTNPTERKKLEIKLRSLKSQVGQWGAKETIWVKFEEAQKSLKRKLSISGEQVDMLIFLLEENAKVYRGAASVARLRKSAKETLNNFVDFQDLNEAAGSLEGTWSELDGIVDRMAADDFVLGIESE